MSHFYGSSIKMGSWLNNQTLIIYHQAFKVCLCVSVNLPVTLSVLSRCKQLIVTCCMQH